MGLNKPAFETDYLYLIQHGLGASDPSGIPAAQVYFVDQFSTILDNDLTVDPASEVPYTTSYYPLVTDVSQALDQIFSTMSSVTSLIGYTPVNKAGDTMLGILTLYSNPVAALDAATKGYVDNLVNGLNWKHSVRASTTGALPSYSVSGGNTILTGTSNGALPSQDGVSLIVGDTLLVKNESGANRVNNGSYKITQLGDASHPYILTRTDDANTGPDLSVATWSIIEGSTQANQIYTVNSGEVTLGTTIITMALIVGPGAYTNGAGLLLTGNVFSIDTAYVSTSTVTGYLKNTDWIIFNNKEPAISAGTTSQYWRGDKSWQDLNSAISGLGYISSVSLTTNKIGYGVAGALSSTANFAFDGTNFMHGTATASAFHYIVSTSTWSEWGTNSLSTIVGTGFRVAASTLTVTSPVSHAVVAAHSFGLATLTSSSSVTYTDAFGVIFQGITSAGSITITRKWAIGIIGNTFINGQTWIDFSPSATTPPLYFASPTQGYNTTWNSNGVYIGVWLDSGYKGSVLEWRSNSGGLFGYISSDSNSSPNQAMINLFPITNTLGGNGLKILSGGIMIGLQDPVGNSLGFTNLIGFGYNANSSNNYPSYIGAILTNTADNTFGDLIFATRSVTTNTVPTIRLRIYSNGGINMASLPASSSGLVSGDLWNNSGVINIV